MEHAAETVIGVFLRMYRERREMKQENLAAELGITQSYLSRLESGKRLLSKKLIRTFIAYFKIPNEYILSAAYESAQQNSADAIAIMDNEKIKRKAELLISLCPAVAGALKKYAPPPQ